MTKREQNWLQRLSELRVYHADHGHGNVPRNYPHNPQLAQWVRFQRTQYQLGKLDSERQSLLADLGVIFTIVSPEDYWQQQFKKLQAYVTNHHQIPYQRDEKYGELNRWLYRQKRLYHSGNLQAQQMKRLQSLNIGIENYHTNDDIWMQHYSVLELFFKRHGHCNIPVHRISNRRLASWICYQRWAYRHHKLHPDKIKLLKHIRLDLEPVRNIARQA